MNNDTTSLDVGRVLSIVSHRWKIVVAIAIVTVSIAYAYVNFLASPVYEATALVTYQAPAKDDNPTAGALPSTGVTREDISTLVANASAPSVVNSAAAKLAIKPQQLRSSVAVGPHGDASVVSFVAKGATPKEAADKANAWADAFVSDRMAKAKKTLDSTVSDAQKSYNAYPKNLKQDSPNLTDRTVALGNLNKAKSARNQWLGALSASNPALEPDAAIWPKKTMTLVAALIIGFGLGSGVALLTARVDNRLHDDEFDSLPAPVLVRVPKSPRAPKNTPLGPANAEPMVADSFAGLGARVMLDRIGEGAHTILVTSARSGEGKSSVAANLASSLALGGRRVVLVDADMRRPTQDQIFPSLQGRPGLSQVLTRGAELDASLTLVSPNLAAISSGPRHANASMLLASVAFRQLLDRLSKISEVIVIDAPPVLAVNDALAVSPAADQVLLVARVDTSDLGEVNEAHSRLNSAASTPQAIVLVGTERPEGYGYDQELRANRPGMMPAPAPQALTPPQSVRPPASMPAAQRGAATPIPVPQPAANGQHMAPPPQPGFQPQQQQPGASTDGRVA
jgi:non-specific protein-tyrosine kinase